MRFTSFRFMFAQRPPLRRGGSCRGSRGGRPMVAPTFTAGTAIKFVGADILARQSLRRLRRHLPLHKGGYPLRRGRADEYPQGAGRICNAPSSRTAALGIGPYKHNRAHGGKTIKRMPCSGLCPLCKKRDTAKAVSLLERVTRLARAAQRPDTHAGTERPHRGLSSADADALFEPLSAGPKRKDATFVASFFLERVTRLELATSTLARWRSTG